MAPFGLVFVAPSGSIGIRWMPLVFLLPIFSAVLVIAGYPSTLDPPWPRNYLKYGILLRTDASRITNGAWFRITRIAGSFLGRLNGILIARARVALEQARLRTGKDAEPVPQISPKSRQMMNRFPKFRTKPRRPTLPFRRQA